MVVLGWELLLSPKVGTGTQIPFSPTSLDMQPLSLGTLQGSDPPEEPGQVGCTSRGGSLPEGRCPLSAVLCGSSSQHPTQMELAVSHKEAQPLRGLPVGAAGVCGRCLILRRSPGRDVFPAAPAARSIPSPGAASPALAPGIAALTLQIF